MLSMLVSFPRTMETVRSYPLTLTLLSEYIELSNCDAHDPLFTPLTQTYYSQLGPVFYQVAGMDIWKDSAIFYCDQIRKAGGDVKLEIYPGVPHTWWSMYPQLSISEKWVRDLVDGVDWLLKLKNDGPVSSRL